MVLHALALSPYRHWGDYLSSSLSVLVSLCLSLSACVSLSLSIPPLCMPLCLCHSLWHSGSISYPDGKTPNLGSDVRDQEINNIDLRACSELKPSRPYQLREGGIPVWPPCLPGALCTRVWKLSTSNFLSASASWTFPALSDSAAGAQGVGAQGKCADSWVPGSDTRLCWQFRHIPISNTRSAQQGTVPPHQDGKAERTAEWQEQGLGRHYWWAGGLTKAFARE